MREKHNIVMRMWIGAPCCRRRASFGFCLGIGLSPPVTYDIRVPKIPVPPARGAGAALCRGKGKLIVVLCRRPVVAEGPDERSALTAPGTPSRLLPTIDTRRNGSSGSRAERVASPPPTVEPDRGNARAGMIAPLRRAPSAYHGV